jgi:hypothetical protein
LAVAITHPAGTRPPMRTRQGTLSFAASSQARIGSGTTEQTTTWKGLASLPRSIIPSINPCLDQPGGCPPTGKSFWWNRDDAMGRDRFGGPKVLQLQTVELGLPVPAEPRAQLTVSPISTYVPRRLTSTIRDDT